MRIPKAKPDYDYKKGILKDRPPLTELENLVLDAQRLRRSLEINREKKNKKALEEEYGKVWDQKELAAAFDVEAYLAPFVIVRRKKDGARGTLEFQTWPRLYFSWIEDEKEDEL